MAADYSDMVNMSFTVTENNIRAIKRRMKINAELAAARSARAIAKDAKANAPVDTGALRDSIRAEGNGLKWTVVVGAPYGVYVEFGTMYMSAQPFLLPAAMRRFPDVVKDLRNSILASNTGAGGALSAIFG